MIHEE